MDEFNKRLRYMLGDLMLASLKRECELETVKADMKSLQKRIAELEAEQTASDLPADTALKT